MREEMKYNPCIYQLREPALKRMLDIIHLQKQSQNNGIVFFGDSIFEFYDSKKYFPDKDYYNCGIAGATTDELMWIVDEAVIKFQPSMVFLHVGTNDMGNTVMRSYREIALNISMIVNLIKKNLPTCKIYVLSPLPCLESLQDFNHANGVRSNLFIEKLYQTLPEYVECAGFIDIYHDFFTEGKVNKSLFKDGLHPNDDGYHILTKRLSNTLCV